MKCHGVTPYVYTTHVLQQQYNKNIYVNKSHEDRVGLLNLFTVNGDQLCTQVPCFAFCSIPQILNKMLELNNAFQGMVSDSLNSYYMKIIIIFRMFNCDTLWYYA